MRGRAVRWAVAWVAIATIALVASCRRHGPGQDTTLAEVKQRGVLRFGSDVQGGEPYLWEDADGHLVGFEVDIMNALAHRLGLQKAEMVQNDWSNLVPALERGDFDIIFNGLEATPARADRILLSRPYYVYGETLTIKKGAGYTTLASLKGKRVGTLNQTYAQDLLAAEPIDTKIYEGNEEPYIDLENGRLDAVLLDNIIADRYGCTRPDLECVKQDVARGSYVAGIRKSDPSLKAAIDDALGDMIRDGEMEKILRSANLWDVRQVEPIPPEIAAATAKVAKPPPARSFDGTQWRRFFSASIVTLTVSFAAFFLLAMPLGCLLAVMRVYGGFGTRAIARCYVELFRGTPVLLQLYVLYFGLAPYYSFGPMQAAILGLGLNYAAYEAEVYRGAILAIPRGQVEASKALGLSPWQTLRHVVLPQALRIALPPMTNDFVSLLKDSSLVSVITVIELTKRMTIAAVELRGWLVPGVACALLYLLMSLPLSELARVLERRLAHDQRPHSL